MATSPSVEDVKLGLANGHALLNDAIEQNAATTSALEGLTFEDITRQLRTIVAALGGMATTAEGMPIQSAHRVVYAANEQYVHTLNGTQPTELSDHLRGALDRTDYEMGQASQRQGLLHRRITEIATTLGGTVNALQQEIIPLREQTGEHARNASAYAERVQQDAEAYATNL